MKKTLLLMIAAAALSGGFSLSAGKPVPYQSDFYIDYSLDDGWQTKNNVRRGGISWSAAGISDDLLTLGAKGAAVKIYSSDHTQTADSWLISPAVDVTAGTEYTVKVYARTTAAYGETECFKITASTSSDVNELKTGTVILDKKDYSNTGGYEELTATFTPDATGEIYFGVQCYSAPDMDHLYLTRFSVTDGNEGGGGDEPVVPVEGKQLPYSFDFSDETTFKADWMSVSGPDAQVTGQWSISTWGGYANWDSSQEKEEDNWLISPALAVSNAGSYAFDYIVYANGTMELLLGTDPTDLTTFKVVKSITDSDYPDTEGKPERENVEITEPGTYHIAFRACSESGTYMGHRVYYAGFKQNVVTPASVTDLQAMANTEDELSVSLSWTYPSLTNTGEELANGDIVKAEVMRGDVVVETFNYPRPGSSWACVDDKITEPGVYTYSVVIYGENGPDTDNAPMVASAGYVGKPMVEFPVSIDLSKQKEMAPLFTISDSNLDGGGWSYDSEAWFPSFKSTNPDNREMDDYLATPYVNLPAGYYMVTFGVGGRNNTYRLGYATNRHQLSTTMTEIATINNDESSAASAHAYVVMIPEAGDYCFFVHHTGALTDPAASYYNEVTFDKFSIEATEILPQVATGLKVTPASDNSLSALVEWTNPSLDNGDQPLTEIAKAVIYRDGEEVATVTENLLPGKTSSYQDDAIDTVGEHTWKVEIHNANGCAEADAPEVTAFVGPGLSLPYETTDFADWKVINPGDDWYYWDTDYDGRFGFSQSFGEPNDYAFTPLIELDSNHKYRLTVVTLAESTLECDLLTGQSYDLDLLAVAGKITPNEAEETEHVFDFSTATEAPAAEDGEEETLIPLAAGKNTFGIHANAIGKIYLKSFKLVDNGEMSGVETTIAAAVAGLGYAAGVVTTTEASTIAVHTLDGRCLMTADGVTTLDLSGLAKGQTVIISAVTSGSRQSLKVVL